MHRAALEQAGIDGTYAAMDVDVDGFTAAVGELRRGEMHGANVTMPHKRLAFELCDVRSPESEQAGAVNTLAGIGGEVVGSNTDVPGIASAWHQAGLPEQGPVNVFGSGGAAAAALVALAGRDIWVFARRPDRAVAMIERAGVEATVCDWDHPPRAGVLVNATPIGMRGEHFAAATLESATGLFDMAYGAQETPAVAAIRSRGLPVAVGLDMLVAQAALSFRIWTGVTVDPDLMREAATTELAARRSGEKAM